MEQIIKIKFLFVFLFIGNFANAQYAKILNDRAIVSHHKRMVYERWGYFYPKPKYKRILFVKVQTNVAASTVWGYSLYGVKPPSWVSPPRNRRYRKGADIRPLKPTGLQNQRYGLRVLEKNETNKIIEETQDLKNKSLRDFSHWTSTIRSADPLWLLYYKKMLKPLIKFPSKPKNYYDWKLSNAQIYQKLRQIGAIEKLQEELDLLKHNYKVSKTVDMPRGKRILLYHKTLIGWRKFKKNLDMYNKETQHFITAKKMLLKSKTTHTNYGSDIEIVEETLNKYKNKL